MAQVKEMSLWIDWLIGSKYEGVDWCQMFGSRHFVVISYKLKLMVESIYDVDFLQAGSSQKVWSTVMGLFCWTFWVESISLQTMYENSVTCIILIVLLHFMPGIWQSFNYLLLICIVVDPHQEYFVMVFILFLRTIKLDLIRG